MTYFTKRLDTPELTREFKEASPYPHIVVDDALDSNALRALVSKS